MANLSNTTSLALPINRQTLFNMWADASLGTIAKDDMAPGVFTMDVGVYLTDATDSPVPGHAFFSQKDLLMYIFHDVIDDTGVSLWLAVGPDRFDVACLANSPVPSCAVVQFDYDKWVGVSTGSSGHVAHQTAFGTCPAGLDVDTQIDFATQASGTWIPVSIDGLVWGVTEDAIGRLFWVKTKDASPGFSTRSSTSLPLPQLGDDVVGLGVQTVAATTDTPTAVRYFWTGPRVIGAL